MLIVGQGVRALPSPTTAPPPPSRDLKLQGTWNTRTLGGLPTRGGVVRGGMVFRSDALQSLTPSDAATLKAIPIRTVMDFRVPAEIQKDGPDRYQAPNRVPLPMGANVHHASAEDYLKLLENCPDAMRGFFTTVATPQNYPLLYHCHSGKDRTGIMTALLLLVLGTPRTAIMDDYMQSQHGRPDKMVDPSWMQGVFKAVDAEGGVERFLQARGVTLAQLQTIRRLLSTGSH